LSDVVRPNAQQRTAYIVHFFRDSLYGERGSAMIAAIAAPQR